HASSTGTTLAQARGSDPWKAAPCLVSGRARPIPGAFSSSTSLVFAGETAVIQNQTAEAPSSKPFILVAEDNRDSRDSLKALLEAYGFDVVVAENGEEAVDRAIGSEPDLVLLDVMMPRVDGIEATRRLRESSEFRQVPILALSAMVGSKELALDAGCDDYLTKPIDIPTLVASIQTWLERGHPSSMSS